MIVSCLVLLPCTPYLTGQTYQYSNRLLLKKREIQKSTKYQALVESQGGDFSPLVIGASGYITSSSKNVLHTTCSKQDASDSGLTYQAYDFWVSKTSLSLHKTAASEAAVRQGRASGRHSSSFFLRDTFPDSVDTHFQMSV